MCKKHECTSCCFLITSILFVLIAFAENQNFITSNMDTELYPDHISEIPTVMTRGHFDRIDPRNNPEPLGLHTKTDYQTRGIIPGFTSETCPSELVIFIHGWLSPDTRLQHYVQALTPVLQQLGYPHPLIGFSWDSDTEGWMTDLTTFESAKLIAEKNGPKLAQFIADYEEKCNSTKIRLISHSLGARVVLFTLDELDKNKSRSESNSSIRSVHLLGAAIDNDIINKDGKFGKIIERNVDEFHNKYDTGDPMLGLPYFIEEFSNPIGQTGIVDPTMKPINYNELNVDMENFNDSQIDGFLSGNVISDYLSKHQRYMGTVIENKKIASNEAMDIVVDDWNIQDPLDNNCRVVVSLKDVEIKNENSRENLQAEIIAGGNRIVLYFDESDLESKISENIVVFDRTISDKDDNVRLSMVGGISKLGGWFDANQHEEQYDIWYFDCTGEDTTVVMSLNDNSSSEPSTLLNFLLSTEITS